MWSPTSIRSSARSRRARATSPARQAARSSTARPSWAICTAATMAAGHFVKMVHNGIEYGMMAAYAEGLGILRDANIGKQTGTIDAETTPLRHPEHYQYDLNLRDIAEVWRRGSVIASWLLDLTAISLVDDPALTKFAGRVSDSGEGRWTIKAAIDEAVPAPVLTAALYERFSSRGEADIQDKLLSAMRFQFGGHLEKSCRKSRPLERTSIMNGCHSDALVFFGATGDLAYKKIFPALQAMSKRGNLNIPIVGVAKAGWNLDQLRARARESVEKHGGLDREAFDRMCRLLRYVDGDYHDTCDISTNSDKELGPAERPAYYLAIPPALFGLVIEQLGMHGLR